MEVESIGCVTANEIMYLLALVQLNFHLSIQQYMIYLQSNLLFVQYSIQQ